MFLTWISRYGGRILSETPHLLSHPVALLLGDSVGMGPGGKELSNRILRSPKQSPVEYALTRDCSQWQEGRGSWWERWHRGPENQGTAFRRSLEEKPQ